MTANRLSDALSPYLLQHAHNPVDWYPWGPEALDLARRVDKPILLSIGYSACHWCHVMAHESFEHEAVARRMNRDFVNIKVDREERPDLDRIYQLSHQLLTGRGGGWPLTVFLDPENQLPFFAGTYFPPERRHGMISFPELLERIAQVWAARRAALRAQNEQLTQALAALVEPRPAAGLDGDDAAETLSAQLTARFDPRHGGFGGAPKFPQTPLLTWMMAHASRDEDCRRMLYQTLTAMAGSGLHDHLGGGFFRYCVDAAWEIPHFEKMLSDNAQLLPLYAEAAVRWNEPALAEVADTTARWLIEEMALAGAGFAASLDADSEAGEGAFYTWTPAAVDDALDAESAERFKGRFGLDGPPNFEGRHWHLVIRKSLAELADSKCDATGLAQQLRQSRDALLAVRDQRPRPGRDDKLIAGWNALAIEGLARAGRLLGRGEWLEPAARALDFMDQRLFAEDPPHAIWRAGHSAHPALLDDHAWLLNACLELLSSRWRQEWLAFAVRLAGRIVEEFSDATGALFLTPRRHEVLITRPLAHTDDATPAGTGCAIIGLCRLTHLTGNPDWLQAALRALEAVAGDWQQQPAAHATMLRAWWAVHRPATQVLLGGLGREPVRWADELGRRPDLLSYRIRPGSAPLPALLQPLAGASRPTAIVCSGNHCLAPVHSLAALQAQLTESGVR